MFQRIVIHNTTFWFHQLKTKSGINFEMMNFRFYTHRFRATYCAVGFIVFATWTCVLGIFVELHALVDGRSPSRLINKWIKIVSIRMESMDEESRCVTNMRTNKNVADECPKFWNGVFITCASHINRLLTQHKWYLALLLFVTYNVLLWHVTVCEWAMGVNLTFLNSDRLKKAFPFIASISQNVLK